MSDVELPETGFARTGMSHHTALIYVMVIMSAVDAKMSDRELGLMGRTVRDLPAFADFDRDMLIPIAESCADILANEEEGLQTVLELSYSALPPELVETAYAVACEVALADGELNQEELRLLDIIRHGLGIDRLSAAAIERGIDALNRRIDRD